MYIAFYNDKLK